MVVKEDGSKWACQSCLKGHRVSGCTHTDRELILVPKKGRPVTQCHHCRQERKKRSAHVSCDCGSSEKQHHPKEKCIHLREAEERAKAAGYHEAQPEKDTAHLARVAEEQGCCCHHGGKCTCALLMKEPGNGSMAPHGPAVKPKLEKTTSEGSITVFQNGHHKPVHRKNHAAHECGMPYKVPMPRHSTDQIVPAAASRSMDSLAMDSDMPYLPSSFMPQTSAPFNTERRMSKSEQPSPRLPPLNMRCSGVGDGKPQDIDFSTLTPIQTNQSVQSVTSDPSSFPTFDPMSGVTDSSFDPWSAYPSADSMNMPNNNMFGMWSNPDENSNLPQPPLTAGSSGTSSEIDEMSQMEEAYEFGMPNIQGDPNFNFANFSTGNSPQFNRRSLPPGFFGNVDIPMNGSGSAWLPPTGNFDNASPHKERMQGSPTPIDVDASWQMSNTRPINVPQRALGGMRGPSRPQSRSVGPMNAPNDDVIKQLFPDIDLNGSNFGPASSPQLSMLEQKAMTEMPMQSPTSAPMDFNHMDSNVGFTSQPWTDGSMSMPNEMMTPPYDLDQNFSNPDFSGNWSQ